MTRLLDVMAVPASGDPTIAVLEASTPHSAEDVRCDVLVVGGGTGGCAAALAAVRAGQRVCLLEETDWIGGQLTSQGVSALDEHEHIEYFGGTRSYCALRNSIREYYRARSSLLAAQPYPNPGNCWVTQLAFEPRVGVSALEALFAPYIESGLLRVFLRTKAHSANVAGDRIHDVLAINLDYRSWLRVTPRIVVDATELGDLLPLVDAEYVVGAEAKDETGEPHAQPLEAKTRCVQSFTYVFALDKTAAVAGNVVPKLGSYEHYRNSQPYSFNIHVHGGEIYGDETGWLQYEFDERAPGTKGGLWTYRRLIDASQFDASSYPSDITMFNWPGNDYRDENLLELSPERQAYALQQAKQVSLGFVHWLQTEASRPGGAVGFPELRIRPDVTGTLDGLAKYPYIRESRRILSVGSVVEQDVSADYQPGSRARSFPDSVGIAWYPIDIHNTGADDVGVSCRTKPFQIPMGTLIPVRIKNLLAGAKNIGTTHITNGCYRLHPVEWNIGEAAGALAAFAINAKIAPVEVWKDQTIVREFQRTLLHHGVPLYWFTDIDTEHDAFAKIQLAAVADEISGSPDSLEFAALPNSVRRNWTSA